MPESGVRLARASDADAVAAINVRAWRQRFEGVLPPAVLQSLDVDDLAMTWASGIINPPTPLHRLMVSVEGVDVLGYAAVGPSQDPDAVPGEAELLALEVDPPCQRQGNGSRLMAAAMDLLLGSGIHSVSCWCPLHDEARRAFLQSAGWAPDTAYRDLLVGQDEAGSDLTLREVRLVTGLADG